MSKYSYKETKLNPPVLEICESPREVIFDVVSCMCDNMSKLFLRKNKDGDFKLDAGSQSLRNFQMEYDFKLNIEWAADDNNWEEVIRIINTGTKLACAVRSR